MTRKHICDRLYEGDNGAFYVRYQARTGRRTWRKLKSIKAKEALAESRVYELTGHASLSPVSFSTLATKYIDGGCWTSRNAARGGSTPEFVESEVARIKYLARYFGDMDATAIRFSDLDEYKSWRQGMVTRQNITGLRAVELDWTTLSNVLWFGVKKLGVLPFNQIASGRDRLRPKSMVRSAREVAPANADEVHKLANFFFLEHKMESLGWQCLFAMLTGCRTNELLSLRMDAKSMDDPGFIDGDFMYIRRSKRGLYPYVKIGPELRECLDCHKQWHGLNHPDSPWFFPGKSDDKPVDKSLLAHKLDYACKLLRMHKITPHGLRSYYATKRRSEGIQDSQIAAELGDKTVELIRSTYADLPESWNGGGRLTFLPSSGEPAWETLTNSNIVAA